MIEAHAEELALQETLDNGKPIRETRAADIPLGAEHFRYFAGVILAEEGSVNEIYNEDISIVLREPIGVVGQIIPWNFPFLMAAGNRSRAGRRLHRGDSPLIQHLAEPAFIRPKSIICCQKACSMLFAGRGSKSGEYMLHHKGFTLAFTGLTEIGRHVGIAAAGNADSRHARIGRQICQYFLRRYAVRQSARGRAKRHFVQPRPSKAAPARAFSQEGIYDKFVAALAEEFKKVKVGLPGRRHPNGRASERQPNGHHHQNM